MSSANLPAQYLEAEEEFRRADTAEAKLEALRKMLALIPKHKGTEKIQGDIKKRIAKWKNQAEAARKKGAKRADPSHVPREGAAQVALIGPVNSGKSSLLAALTNSLPAIGDYPFTTRMPQPGMLFHQGIPIQLVDTPALDPAVTEKWIGSLIRNTDMAVMVLDLARDDLLEQWEAVHTTLDSLRIRLEPPGSEKRFTGDGWAIIPTLYLGNKCRMEAAKDRLEVLADLYQDLPEIHPVSVRTGSGLEGFKDLLKGSMGLIRVFSKPPGKEVDLDQPFVLREGATVADLASMVHKDIGRMLKFARVWGTEVFDGQKVARDYVLLDGDVVELNT
ncbi:MAG: TGS domain-containing protein [bacterium]|nr:MAG: TGS domain-containing protein [bacterium]